MMVCRDKKINITRPLVVYQFVGGETSVPQGAAWQKVTENHCFNPITLLSRRLLTSSTTRTPLPICISESEINCLDDINVSDIGKKFICDIPVKNQSAAQLLSCMCVCVCVPSEGICVCLPSQDSRRERSSNFQAFVKMALETLLGSCRRKHGGPQGRQC